MSDPGVSMTAAQRLALMQAKLRLLAHDCEVLSAELGHQQPGTKASRPLDGGAHEAVLRRPIRPSIVLELREDGLVLISGWADGRRDSAYRPMPLSEALGEISALAQELQQQPLLSSSDAHAR